MDKNTVIGIVLITGILILFSVLNKPTDQEREKIQRIRDSIERAELEKKIREEQQKMNEAKNVQEEIKPAEERSQEDLQKEMQDKLGVFGNAGMGEEAFYTLENDLIKLVISNKGGKIYSAEIKGYQTYDSLPLYLFKGDSTTFGFEFFARNRHIFTNNLFFEAYETTKNNYARDESKIARFRLETGDDKFIEYVYRINPESYLIDFDVNFIGMDDVIAPNTSYLDFVWEVYMPQLEKSFDNENDYSTISYHFPDDEVSELSSRGKEENSEEINTRLKWIAFKQQFFSSIFVSEDNFSNAYLEFEKLDPNLKHLKRTTAKIGIPYDVSPNQTKSYLFYFGPNHYNTLKKYDRSFEEVIPLGWGIFGWVNKFLIIPVFNFLNGYTGNYGIIILLLTIFIKILVFPLTYKSYMSSAKMRVLKPQVDEIGKKFPKKEDAMKKQQATMALYKKVGVSPMGGCLPLLIQMPVLIAMFRFFPASFELRQESFLWANDLSTYDSVLSLPFEVPFGYGDHVSLFTLLMTISTIIYSKVNSQATAGGQQMPGMKMMMYFMPIMLLFVFNNYAAGLSYYLLVANLFTFLQMFVIKQFVDDEAILKKLEANANKKQQQPAKKSKFQERIEKMAKERGQQLPKKK